MSFGNEGGATGQRPRVLVAADHYLPGVNGGGPIRSIAAIVRALGNEVDFRVVTRDRDLGATEPYRDVVAGAWTSHEETRVFYCPEGEPSLATWQRLIHETCPDVVYLNSFFSPRFSIAPLLVRRRGKAPGVRFVLAPRGELHPGALALKRPKKEAFLRLSRALGLLRGVVWHATVPEEAEQIRRWFGVRALAGVAPVLAGRVPGERSAAARKRPGVLEVAFLSRISPKKNLLGAIELLSDVAGDVRFNVYGPKEDADYWQRCRRALDALPANVTVRDHGPVEGEKVTAALAGNHVLLFPTHGENFGHVVLEALLAGVPVLTSDQTPWRDLELHAAGWDLPLTRPQAFRDKLAELVAMDGAEHARWSRGARRLGLAYAEDREAVARNRALFVGDVAA